MTPDTHTRHPGHPQDPQRTQHDTQHIHTRTFPGRRTSVADARHWLEDLLARSTDPKIPGETVAAAALLLSEAATNAVLHTDTGHDPGGAFTVRLHITAATLTVHVEDDGAAETAVPAAPALTPAGADAESGRGLVLIDAFADDWGPISRESQCHGLYYTLSRHEPSDDAPAVRP
ncbi:ATP-binding protein [Streptomonospora litoralis]|uniref:Anti-sigma F factor n=1 Tax=Streptomonospora litoralis TaxID=2498135 RepID=A0A4P6PZJ2_9ACTN|nr:ATP-binding protein [Streptomonospora litoralis]QBI53668.1 anti-sigma F factor [Streptomonospora litoralis]